MSANKEHKLDLLDRLSLYEDSIEVADSVRELKGRYWAAEASVQIVGLWNLANDLAGEVKRLKELRHVGGRGISN